MSSISPAHGTPPRKIRPRRVLTGSARPEPSMSTTLAWSATGSRALRRRLDALLGSKRALATDILNGCSDLKPPTADFG